jgi:DNA-binding CsgD family transcriptional regulator
MPTQVARATALGVSAELPGNDRIEVIAAQLVERVLAASVSVDYFEVDGEVHEVVLDLSVAGARCLVTRAAPRPDRPPIILSPRELEISRMVAKGYANKTIAAVLDISSWTVSTYLRRIFAKLGVGSRAAMVARLLEEGLIKSGPPHQEQRSDFRGDTRQGRGRTQHAPQGEQKNR